MTSVAAVLLFLQVCSSVNEVVMGRQNGCRKGLVIGGEDVVHRKKG
jgi:hypothetical protein